MYIDIGFRYIYMCVSQRGASRQRRGARARRRSFRTPTSPGACVKSFIYVNAYIHIYIYIFRYVSIYVCICIYI